MARLVFIWLTVLFVLASAATAQTPPRGSVSKPAPTPTPPPSVIPDDPLLRFQWALWKIQAPEAWSITTGSERVIIAILSTGVMLPHRMSTHPDLGDKIWVNPGEIPGNDIDDDENGYVDDVHGWDFVNDDNDPTDDCCAKPLYGPGTHLAGIAAADTNNGIGIAGLSWEARIMPVKVLDNYGAVSWPIASQGIIYAADNGAQVILMAFWGTGYSEGLREAVEYAHSKGSFLIAPAGDYTGGPFPPEPSYPAALPYVVGVAATDQDDRWVSGYGPAVSAPGSLILSTACRPDDYPYTFQSGTVFAAAHVAGLAALVYSVNPDLTTGQVEQIIELSADDVEEPGWDEYTGAGRINALAALLSTPSPRGPRSIYLPVLSRN